ncbi:MAG: amidohydrolase family protein, partial [Kiritimatiellaeota bacterium]|nr:amidohydrolase family protein [Kiritimatiellota bacterium]
LVASVNPVPHIANLIGHRTLRKGVMGMAPRAAAPDEVRTMGRALEESLDAGAIGLSTGLLYDPGRYADASEIEFLARIVARHGGIYATHLRNEGAHVLPALDEALSVARSTGVRLQISHLKVSGKENWHLAEAMIGKIESARASGIDVHADCYPYAYGATELDILPPPWAEQGTPEARLARLRDPAMRDRILDEMGKRYPPEAWRDVTVGGTWHPETHPFRGRCLEDAARAKRLSPAEMVLWLIEKDALRTGGFFGGMSEESLRLFLSCPWVMVGTDASIRSPRGILSRDHPHPRAYGAFPRLLAWCRDGGPLTLPETIRRMTSLAAATFRLPHDAILRANAPATFVLFDPAAVRDRATLENPHQPSIGIHAVFINGEKHSFR